MTTARYYLLGAYRTKYFMHNNCWWCTSLANKCRRRCQQRARWHRDGIVEWRQCRYVTSKYFLIIYDETNDHKHTCHVCYSHKVPMMYQYRLYGIHKRLIFTHSCYCRGRCLKEVIVMKILLSSLTLYAQSFHPLVFCYLCKYLLIWLLKSLFLFLIPFITSVM